MRSFPFGAAMMKDLTIKAGNCNHRTYIPRLIERVAAGAIDPRRVLTQEQPLADVIEAYEAFDRREAGWIKVKLEPRKAARGDRRPTCPLLLSGAFRGRSRCRSGRRPAPGRPGNRAP
ncbi:MAG: hypothetical protein KBD01_20000 [Acidobacteria bacterium]|nr:hypothetical protein [Acidobacteriota bacterium]